MTEPVIHPLPIWGDEHARVLILGSFPSPRSRDRRMYYGHPRNRFWQVMADLFQDTVPEDAAAAEAFCHRHHLALSDVLASCRIEGASDASIRDAVPMDLSAFLAEHQIRHIFCTGSTAGKLYKKYLEPILHRPSTVLPSTSPANARFHLSDLLIAYQDVALLAQNPTPFEKGTPLLDLEHAHEQGEAITVLYEDEKVRIEKIESHNASAPQNGFYDQAEIEWVSVLKGWAILQDEQGGQLLLSAGEHTLLPAHAKHRVASTAEDCIWLCVFSK